MTFFNMKPTLVYTTTYLVSEICIHLFTRQRGRGEGGVQFKFDFPPFSELNWLRTADYFVMYFLFLRLPCKEAEDHYRVPARAHLNSFSYDFCLEKTSVEKGNKTIVLFFELQYKLYS